MKVLHQEKSEISTLETSPLASGELEEEYVGEAKKVLEKGGYGTRCESTR